MCKNVENASQFCVTHNVIYSYVEAQADRVTVVFSTVFRDEDDIVLGKVFMVSNYNANNVLMENDKVIYTRAFFHLYSKNLEKVEELPIRHPKCYFLIENHL